MSPPTDFDDFTEAAYAELLEIAIGRFAFEPFGSSSAAPHVLWRHDIDVSMQRALALAQIEAAKGARSTWFVSLHSTFYNALEADAAECAREILRLGHWLGLHFDLAAYPPLADAAELDRLVERERRVLEDWLARPVTAVSFHNPDVIILPTMRDDYIAGLPNAYASSLEARYQYVSDSNGYWRFRRLADVLVESESKRLHVLTHAEWWPPEPMSPRARIARAARGRADATLRDYDAALERLGRTNVSDAG